YLFYQNPDDTLQRQQDGAAFAINTTTGMIIAAPLDRDVYNLADLTESQPEQGNLTGDVEYKAFDLILRSYNITMSGVNDIYIYDTSKDTISDDWRCNSSL
ncbi:hypothetical protein COT48_02500, partial [Candidatus Woesearchaeota archaeon CG08_land_8_20_14_0_20_47_9]